MPKTSRPIIQVPLICCKCGTRSAIWRLGSRLRDRNHTKHVWCHICNKKTAHYQVDE